MVVSAPVLQPADVFEQPNPSGPKKIEFHISVPEVAAAEEDNKPDDEGRRKLQDCYNLSPNKDFFIRLNRKMRRTTADVRTVEKPSAGGMKGSGGCMTAAHVLEIQRAVSSDKSDEQNRKVVAHEGGRCGGTQAWSVQELF